jgi:hypothetical protein
VLQALKADPIATPSPEAQNSQPTGWRGCFATISAPTPPKVSAISTLSKYELSARVRRGSSPAAHM